MASSTDFAEYVCGQLSGAGEMRARKMFGEYGVYCGEKIIGLICDNQFFLKPTAAARRLLGEPQERAPYVGASLYFLIEDLENAAFVSQLTAVTYAELPAPRPRRKK